MKIECRNCKNIETVNTGLFVKIIGGALPVGGGLGLDNLSAC